MSAGGLLVERGGRKLLVDAGLGSFQGDMAVGEEPFGARTAARCRTWLAELGVSPATSTRSRSPTCTWTTSAGPCTDGRKSSETRVPGATESGPRTSTDHGARRAHGDDRRPMRGNHELIREGEEIWPGVRAVVTPGTPRGTRRHRRRGAGRSIAFGDAFHAPAQLAPRVGVAARHDTDTGWRLKARTPTAGGVGAAGPRLRHPLRRPGLRPRRPRRGPVPQRGRPVATGSSAHASASLVDNITIASVTTNIILHKTKRPNPQQDSLLQPSARRPRTPRRRRA